MGERNPSPPLLGAGPDAGGCGSAALFAVTPGAQRFHDGSAIKLRRPSETVTEPLGAALQALSGEGAERGAEEWLAWYAAYMAERAPRGIPFAREHRALCFPSDRMTARTLSRADRYPMESLTPEDVRPRLQVRRSPIHGRGLFAAEAIPAGCLIGIYQGRPTGDDGPHVLWVENDDGGESGIDGTNELRYLNHSPEPNAEFDGVELWAIRPIPPGSEITFHYGPEWDE